MHIAYWIVAGLLALLYLYSGILKLVRSQAQLQPMMQWAGTTVPMPYVRVIGVLEVLGAIGLILPPLTGVAPVLAPAAAIGLVLVQIGALVVHVRRGDRQIWFNIALLVVAAVVGWLAVGWL